MTRLIWQSAAIVAGLSEIALGQPSNTEASRDVPLIRQTLNDVLSSKNDGQATDWKNPQTGNYGQITPRTTYDASNGQPCRTYMRTWVVNGSESTYTGAACRDSEGIWRVQGIEALASQRPIPPPTITGPPPNPGPPQSGPVAGGSGGPTPQPPGIPNPSPNPPGPTPPRPPLIVTLPRDGIRALELGMERLGLPVGVVDGNLDVKSQEAARIFWRDQSKTGSPTVDENLLTLVQIALSADQSRGGVPPVVITAREAIGVVPESSHFP